MQNFKFRIYVIIFILTILMLPGCGVKKVAGGRITVIVNYEKANEGLELSGVLVELYRGGKKISHGFTDNTGQCIFIVNAAFDYSIYAYKSFEDGRNFMGAVQEPFPVGSGQNVSKEVELTESPPTPPLG